MTGRPSRRAASSVPDFTQETATDIRRRWTEKHSEVIRLVRSSDEYGGRATIAEIATHLKDSEYHVGCLVNELARLCYVRQHPDGRITLDIGIALEDCPLVGEVS